MNAIFDSQCEIGAIASGVSALGAIAVAVSDGKVTHVRFGYATEREALAALVRGAAASWSDSKACPGENDEQLAEEVLARLQQYAEGEPVNFDDVAVSLEHLSTFQRRVVKACRAIPAGERRTYGQLAAAAGSPGAARAVGQVMAGNRVPLVVPCHRVVASGGGLGGFSAPQGLAMKRRLLALEAALVAAN